MRAVDILVLEVLNTLKKDNDDLKMNYEAYNINNKIDKMDYKIKEIIKKRCEQFEKDYKKGEEDSEYLINAIISGERVRTALIAAVIYLKADEYGTSDFRPSMYLSE